MKENNPIFGIRGAFLRNGERKMRQVSINTIRRSPVDKLAVKTAVHSQVVEHIHDSLELAYVLEGSAKHFLRAEAYAVKKGDYFFVDFGTAHGYSGTEDFQVLNCMFLPELIEESLVGCTSFDQLLRVCLGRYHNQQMIQTPVNRIFTDGDGQILALLQGICREAETNRLGSREILPDNKAFAWAVGEQAAKQGYALVSGNARGADKIAQTAALRHGGKVISVVADSLAEKAPQENLLYLSEEDYDLGFSAQRALSRNRVIHAMGDVTFVAQCSFGTGGTWSGTQMNLRSGWSPVYCFNDGSDAARELEQMGAALIKEDALHSLHELSVIAQNLFDQ